MKTKLGVLIAIGISAAGVLMTTIFFLFIPTRTKPRQSDWIFSAVKTYVARILHRPRSILAVSAPILIVLVIIAVLPQIPLTFVANARSMEPKNSRAGRALSLIMQKMPVRWEPVLGIVVIRVVRIGEGFELRIEAGDAAAIFRRRRVFAGDVARISQGRVGGTRLGQGEVVFPAITHVIGVVEPCGAWLEQVLKGQPGGAAAADALATESEFPQMRVLPVHGGLNDPMELLERHRDRHLDLAPDRRIAVDQVDAQRGDRLGLGLVLGAHAASLAAG